MSNRLLKTDELQIGGQAYSVKYFENQTTRGTLRYSSELLLGPAIAGHDLAHQPGRLLQVGLGPDLILVARIGAGWNRDQPIGDREAGRFGEEVGIAGIVGADYRLAESHRFRHCISQRLM